MHYDLLTAILLIVKTTLKHSLCQLHWETNNTFIIYTFTVFKLPAGSFCLKLLKFFSCENCPLRPQKVNISITQIHFKNYKRFSSDLFYINAQINANVMKHHLAAHSFSQLKPTM